MDKKKWKNGITISSILLFWILLHDNPIMRLMLVILLVTGLSCSVFQIAKENNTRFHCKISFALAIITAIAILMSEKLVFIYILLVLEAFLYILALYRTCFPARLDWNKPGQILQDIFQLSFFNIFDYINPVDNSTEAKKKKTVNMAATVFMMVVLFILLGTGIRADANFKYMVGVFINGFFEELPYIGLSILYGVILSAFLYGYISSLSQEYNKEYPVCTHNSGFKENNNTDPFIKDIYFNPVCYIYILNVTLFIDSVILIINIFTYWNPLGLKFVYTDKNYYENGFWSYFIYLIVNFCIFLCVYRLLQNNKLVYPEEEYLDWQDREELFTRIRKKLFITSLVCIGIFVFVVARFLCIIYRQGITNNNFFWLYGLLAEGMVLYNVFVYAFRDKGNVFKLHKVVFMVLVFAVFVFIWNKNLFPLYNLWLFQAKYSSGELVNASSGQPKEDIVISAEDIDINYMATSGKYAIPPLVSLLDKDNPYAGTGYSVSEYALKCIGNIYIEESETDRQKIEKAEGFEKLDVIVRSMEDNIFYSFGFRAYCLQSIKDFINSYGAEGGLETGKSG